MWSASTWRKHQKESTTIDAQNVGVLPAGALFETFYPPEKEPVNCFFTKSVKKSQSRLKDVVNARGDLNGLLYSLWHQK